MSLLRTVIGAALVVGLAAGPALADLPEEGRLDVPGEGISGSLLPPEASDSSAGIVDTAGPRFRFSEEELRAQSLLSPWEGGAAVAESLPPIMVRVSTVVYEQVPVYEKAAQASQAHRRRSMASRGAHMAPAPAPAAPRVVGYRTVARRGTRQVNLAPIIEKYARMHDLDPWLVRGVIEVESAFRPDARSYAGAGGLMQLMPATAAGLGCKDRFDPESNIAAGTRYLRQMLDRFGSHDLAIAAYNAGPGNVSKFGGIPPFAETQRYVVKVRRAWERRGR